MSAGTVALLTILALEEATYPLPEPVPDLTGEAVEQLLRDAEVMELAGERMVEFGEDAVLYD